MRLRGFILEEYIRSADEQICDKHVVIFFIFYQRPGIQRFLNTLCVNGTRSAKPVSRGSPKKLDLHQKICLLTERIISVSMFSKMHNEKKNEKKTPAFLLNSKINSCGKESFLHFLELLHTKPQPRQCVVVKRSTSQLSQNKTLISQRFCSYAF